MLVSNGSDLLYGCMPNQETNWINQALELLAQYAVQVNVLVF
jgi:hypothetical protein